ncbi:MAG: tetratricopeptide repeat protein [Polyangiaceae bacterium]
MVTYNDLGKYDRARDIYTQIRHRGQPGAALTDPFAKGKIANMHADVGQAYLDAGMRSEAIHELERAVALCPEFADLRTRLAAMYRDAGNPELAKDQLYLALEHNVRYAPARVMLGVLLLSSGDLRRRGARVRRRADRRRRQSRRADVFAARPPAT